MSRRPAPTRWPAFAALGAGLLAVLVMVFVVRHGEGGWSQVGSPRIVDTAPADLAIVLVAARTNGGGLSVAALAKGRGSRCLSIQFTVDGQPGRSAETLGNACRPSAILGRGLQVGPGHRVRVYAAGTLLREVVPSEVEACGGSPGNLCAMAFDRHADRLPLQERRRNGDETDRDDGLLDLIRSGGARSEVVARDVPEPRDVRFGKVRGTLWAVELRTVTGKPTPAEALGMLLTRRGGTFTVQVEPRRLRGSTRSLVLDADGAFSTLQ